jgi:hypothetical protein
VDNPHAHEGYPLEEKQYGTNKAYLLERLPDEVVANIGKGKQFKTVHEAARKTEVINVPQRYSLPSDPIAAAHYLFKHVDREWIAAMVEEFMKVLA